MATPALASPAPTGTITLDQADPHAGDTITFTVTLDRRVNGSLANYLSCANGWSDYQAVGQPFVLGWADGGATDCYVDLVYYTRGHDGVLRYSAEVADVDFHVGAAP